MGGIGLNLINQKYAGKPLNCRVQAKIDGGGTTTWEILQTLGKRFEPHIFDFRPNGMADEFAIACSCTGIFCQLGIAVPCNARGNDMAVAWKRFCQTVFGNHLGTGSNVGILIFGVLEPPCEKRSRPGSRLIKKVMSPFCNSQEGRS